VDHTPNCLAARAEQERSFHERCAKFLAEHPLPIGRGIGFSPYCICGADPMVIAVARLRTEPEKTLAEIGNVILEFLRGSCTGCVVIKVERPA
jgi:hypothetical protein